ncbi:MAG: VPLPA-CTERM sorting domain-containing protein [Pseudomonadota bacterium]|nr:VPLPA-CTERM sorting domain-containing protein [Pseudomonadota bacterium]
MISSVRLGLKVIIIGLSLSVSLGASALPLSPKWMKSSVQKKIDEPRSGAFDDNNGGPDVGVAPRAVPVPASLWLILIGAAGMALVRRNKD